MLVAWNADILISFLLLLSFAAIEITHMPLADATWAEVRPSAAWPRELVRTAYHRANTVAQNPATEGEGCWYPLIKNTTIPAKDLEALATTNRVFLGDFDKNTVPQETVEKIRQCGGEIAVDGVVAVLALVKSKRSRRTLKTRIYRAPEIH